MWKQKQMLLHGQFVDFTTEYVFLKCNPFLLLGEYKQRSKSYQLLFTQPFYNSMKTLLRHLVSDNC